MRNQQLPSFSITDAALSLSKQATTGHTPMLITTNSYYH